MKIEIDIPIENAAEGHYKMIKIWFEEHDTIETVENICSTLSHPADKSFNDGICNLLRREFENTVQGRRYYKGEWRFDCRNEYRYRSDTYIFQIWNHR